MTLLTIGQLGRKAGFRPSAIRYYEAQGILDSPSRSATGYRRYDADAVVLLDFVRRAKELGFSIDEIRQLIETSRKRTPCALSRQLIEHRLGTVESEIRRLNLLRDRLKRLIQKPDRERKAAGVCPLIEGEQP